MKISEKIVWLMVTKWGIIMLNFIIGRENIDLNQVDMDSRVYFKEFKKPEWFTDPFAVRVIKEIDKAEVIFEEALKNRFGHGMSTMELSTGTKTLLLLRNRPGHIYYGSLLGDNCVPFLMELVNGHPGDITLLLEHYMEIPEEYEGVLKVSGKPVSIFEYEMSIAEWCEHRDDPEYKWR